MLKNTLKFLNREIYWGALIKAVISLLPVALAYVWSGNIMFWNVGLVTISLGIGAERLKLDPVAISLHFLLIIVCFSLLFFAFQFPWLFVFTCALMAFATIYFTQYGSKIRTLANYTFIPTVYLTCELHENMTSSLVIDTYEKFIILTPLAWITTILIFTSGSKKWSSKIWQGIELGEPEQLWVTPAIAIFLGVMTAASLVIFLHISRGEWVIWSVASVITLEFSSSRKKFTDRMVGASIGVPLGLLAGQFAPKIELIYIFAVLGIMLTLVSFKRYRLAFGCRCFFVALAAFLASSTPVIAVERIMNVLAGGLIGVIAVYLAELIFNTNRRISHD